MNVDAVEKQQRNLPDVTVLAVSCCWRSDDNDIGRGAIGIRRKQLSINRKLGDDDCVMRGGTHNQDGDRELDWLAKRVMPKGNLSASDLDCAFITTL